MAEKTRGNIRAVPCKVAGSQAVEAEFPIFDFCDLGVGVEVDKDGASLCQMEVSHTPHLAVELVRSSCVLLVDLSLGVAFEAGMLEVLVGGRDFCKTPPQLPTALIGSLKLTCVPNVSV
jgi:hypothetical protein